MACAYPILLELAGLPVLIIGGGEVAARKARGLLAAGADRVTVVATAFARDFPAGVTRITAPYQSSHLAGMRLVFAATNNAEVNRQVTLDAHAAGLLVNRVDHDAECRGDFSVPAVHRDGTLCIAVATGHSPALSAAVRDEVARRLDAGWGKLADLTDALRPRILALHHLSQSQRTTLLRRLASPEALEAARTADVEAMWKWLLSHQQADPSVS